MTASTHQSVVLGTVNEFLSNTLATFKTRVQDLGLNPSAGTSLTSTNFHQYKVKAPTVCLYFGNEKDLTSNAIELQTLIKDCVFIVDIPDDVDPT